MADAARRNSSSGACCAIAIRCGTRYEEGFHSGTAHFAEHALFRGTSLKSARVIGSFLDRLGGDLNAYTTKEEIVIHATVLKEDVRKEFFRVTVPFVSASIRSLPMAYSTTPSRGMPYL